MKRYEMIKKHEDFTNIINQNNYMKNDYFVLYYEKSANLYPRFGLAISKKYGNAVERNYVKRQLRNIIDKHKKLFKKDYNYIIMIRKTCLYVTYQQLEEAMTSLMKEKL